MGDDDKKKIKPEWPNFMNVQEFRDYQEKRSGALPMLISECSRLIPTLNKTTGYEDFHPFGMPDIKVKYIRLIGMVLDFQKRQNYKELELYDGTGIITVLHRVSSGAATDNYAEDDEDEVEVNRMVETMTAELPERTDTGTPTERQQSNKECFEIGNYVEVTGYCNMRGDAYSKVKTENLYWGPYSMPEMVFNSRSIKLLSEEEYNKQIQNALDSDIKQKYIACTSRVD